VLDISLLGEVRVAIDSSLVALRSSRVLALLGFLVVHQGAPQRREYIAAQFWPDSPEPQARTNLRRELHALRAELPQVDRWLVATGGTLLWQLDPSCRVDVEVFETAADRAAAARAAADMPAFRLAAADALRAYRGGFMPALYDDWALAERDRLHRRCLGLLDQLTEAERSDGSYGPAIELARRRIDLEPLEEAGYRTLLQLQALAGDRAAALQTYHRCTSVLERELGVAPDPATAAEYERLASGERGRTTGVPAAADKVPAASPVRLVGRERELGLLRRRWQEAAHGRAGFVVVAGEAGVGKSRLVDEFCSVVHRGGFDALRARCFAARGRLALAPVSEWLRSPALRAARDRLDPVWAREVDRLVPAAPAGPVTLPRPMADAWQRYRFFEGLARAVLSSGRPIVLTLDDLQWCDEHTLAWLQLLLHLGKDHPLLVVAATRIEEVDGNAELTEMLRALRSAGQVTDVTLEPLDAARSAKLAAQVRGTALTRPEAAWLHAATGGYPFLVIESVRARLLDGVGAGDGVQAGQPDPGPQVRALLADRIAQAGPAAREVAELAAVIGRDFTLDLLSGATDLDGDTVVGAVDELWQRRLLREHSPASYDFIHDLLRATAYSGISPPRRSLLHRRVAEALSRVHADDPGVAAAAAAYHFERGDRPARSVPHHVLAAEVATSVFANQKAIRHYRRAAELLQQTPAGRDRDERELAIRAAMAAPLNAQQGYASTELQAVYERVRDLAVRLDHTRLELVSLVGLVTVRYVQGHVAESYEIAKRSLDLSHLHPEVAGHAHAMVAGTATSLGLHEQSLPHFALAHELCYDAPPSLAGTRLEVHARAWSAHALWLLGREQEALHWCDWALRRADEVGHPYTLAVALAYAAITHQLRRDSEQTLEFATRVREICTRYGFAYYGNWGVILAGWCSGGTDGAEQIREGLGHLRDQGSLVRHPYYLALLAETLLAAGKDDSAGAVLESARVAAEMHADNWWLPELYRLGARRHRDDAAAGDLLRSAIAVAEQHGSVALASRAGADLAQLTKPGAVRTGGERSANA
jgi:DNA-binding SARP family transcriptional activator/tetratricopeptide (TPR) repeat protein